LIRHRELRERLRGTRHVRPSRDTVEAGSEILQALLEDKPPISLDPGFSRAALLGQLADLLESLLLDGNEEAVRSFARRAPRWEPILPGIGSLVSGA
jgi:hypothetical protein